MGLVSTLLAVALFPFNYTSNVQLYNVVSSHVNVLLHIDVIINDQNSTDVHIGPVGAPL